MRTVGRVLLGCTLLGMLAVPGYAQRSTGDLVGTVKDDSGGVLPGVVLTSKHMGTGLERTVTTNDAGNYVIASLPVGTYELSAELQGFQKSVITGINLQFDQRARIDVVLKVGAVEETLTVAGEAPLIETDTSTVGQIMSTETITALPLNKRDYLSLSLLTPGVVPAQQGSIVAFFRGAVQVNGAPEEANNFMLDGVANKDNMIQGIVLQPSLDAIQEFKIQSSTYSAEYGHGGGAQINIITKAGTNQFRGSLFEFHRDEKFDARNYFAPKDRPKPNFQMDQFGGSIGGPIILPGYNGRGKTFFFLNYEGRRLAQETSKAATVPTLLMREGNFQGRNTIYDPLTFDPLTGTRQPFPNNIIPAGRINPSAAQVLGLLPLPNQGGTLNFISAPEFKDDMDTYLGRIDHQLPKQNTLTVRYGRYNGDRFSPFQRFNDRDLPGYGDTFDAVDTNAMVGLTTVFGSNKVNEFKFGFARANEGFIAENNDIDYVTQLGIQGLPANPDFNGMPQTLIQGIGSFGDGSSFPQVRLDDKYQFINNFTVNAGDHTFKMGGDIIIYQQYMILHSRERLTFNSNFTRDPRSPGTTGDGFADFLLGYPTQTARRVGIEDADLRSNFYQFYFQDDWKVGENVTLNLGLRYEYGTPYYDVRDFRSSFDPTTGQLIYPDNPAGTPRSLYDADKNNWGPRVGAAWRIFGTNRTVVRTGFGMFYAPENGNGQHSLHQNPPITTSQTFNALPTLPNLTYTQPFLEGALSQGALNVAAIDKHFDVGRIQQWNVNLQQEMSRNLAVDVGYVGSRGDHMQRNVNINAPVPGSTPIQTRRPFPQFGNINAYRSIFPSNYHALQTKLDGRFGSSNLLATYTLSKSTDILSSYYNGGLIQNPYDLEDSRGPSNFDRRHVVNISYVAALPFGDGRRFLSDAGRVTNAIVSDWQINGIASFASGNPVTVILATDNSGTAQFADRPNVIGDPIPANQGPDMWIDPAAFAVPPPLTFGNAGRNSVVGPGISRIDISLFKAIRVGGERKLDIRFEVFNALNRPNFYQPNNRFGTPQFGKITQAYDGRDIQIGARFSF